MEKIYVYLAIIATPLLIVGCAKDSGESAQQYREELLEQVRQGETRKRDPYTEAEKFEHFSRQHKKFIQSSP